MNPDFPTWVNVDPRFLFLVIGGRNRRKFVMAAVIDFFLMVMWAAFEIPSEEALKNLLALLGDACDIIARDELKKGLKT